MFRRHLLLALSVSLGLAAFLFLTTIGRASSAPPYRLRIFTAIEGLHRLSYDDLAKLGVAPEAIDLDALALTLRGEPVAIQLVGMADGRFDPDDLLIFYAEPYTGRYQNENVYQLLVDADMAWRMKTRHVTGSETEPHRVMTRTARIEFNRVYLSNSGRPTKADHWFDDPLMAVGERATRVYTISTPFAADRGEARLSGLLHGGMNQTPPLRAVSITVNFSYMLPAFHWTTPGDHVIKAAFPVSLLLPGEIALHLDADQTEQPLYLDWLSLDYPAYLQGENDRLLVPAISVGSLYQADGFSSDDVRVYDVRDPKRPVWLTHVEAAPAGAGFGVRWRDLPLPAPRYALSARSALIEPAAVEPYRPSQWRSSQHRGDYIAIVHSSLSDAVQPLLDHRSGEGFRVVKVDVQDIYDEFGYGFREPNAIRAFLSYAYQHWNPGEERPRYVLLVGDGHYDFRGDSGTNLPNLIPPYLVNVDPWLGETASDNRYVSFDGPNDYLPEMHIGRIPARTPADVEAVVEKILAYEAAPAGDWQKRVVLAADAPSGFDADFPAITRWVEKRTLWPSYERRWLIYRQTYVSGEAMRAAFRQAFDEGALILQWFGHASRFRWGSVSMFNIFDVPQLRAHARLPVTFTYACWSGYFINLHRGYQSLGETLLLTPGRGSVADISPAGLHIGDNLSLLNEGIMKAIFRDEVERIGPALDAGKRYFDQRSPAWRDLIDTTILFGDPALRLRRPEPWSLRRSRFGASNSPAPDLVTLPIILVNADGAPLSGVTIILDYDARLIERAESPAARSHNGRLIWTLSPFDAISMTQAISLSLFSLRPPALETTITMTLQTPTQLDVILSQTFASPMPQDAVWLYFPRLKRP
ncbi:MAG: hypothetical protein GXP42_14235 [Chloroflexi bacterium]|nr:hypothetical protein [Chloroflexota bacterium]